MHRRKTSSIQAFAAKELATQRTCIYADYAITGGTMSFAPSNNDAAPNVITVMGSNGAPMNMVKLSAQDAQKLATSNIPFNGATTPMNASAYPFQQTQVGMPLSYSNHYPTQAPPPMYPNNSNALFGPHPQQFGPHTQQQCRSSRGCQNPNCPNRSACMAGNTCSGD